LLHHDRKLAVERKAAIVVTQTDLILLVVYSIKTAGAVEP
jgi:hypothetical protein